MHSRWRWLGFRCIHCILPQSSLASSEPSGTTCNIHQFRIQKLTHGSSSLLASGTGTITHREQVPIQFQNVASGITDTGCSLSGHHETLWHFSILCSTPTHVFNSKCACMILLNTAIVFPTTVKNFQPLPCNPNEWSYYDSLEWVSSFLTAHQHKKAVQCLTSYRLLIRNEYSLPKTHKMEYIEPKLFS